MACQARPVSSSEGAHRAIDAVDRERQWRAVFDANFEAAYRLTARLGIPALECEDIVQRAFEIAFVRVERGMPVDDVGRFLRGTILHLVRTRRRWARVRRTYAWVVDGLFPTTETETPERDAARMQVRSRIDRVLDTLGPKLRDVLVLSDLEDRPLDEIADLLEIPVNTVRSRRRIARERFRAEWEAAERGEEAR